MFFLQQPCYSNDKKGTQDQLHNVAFTISFKIMDPVEIKTSIKDMNLLVVTIKTKCTELVIKTSIKDMELLLM